MKDNYKSIKDSCFPCILLTCHGCAKQEKVVEVRIKNQGELDAEAIVYGKALDSTE